MASIENIDYYKNGKKKPNSKARKWRAYAYEGVKDPKTGRYKRRTMNIKGMSETQAQAEANRFEDEVRKAMSSTMKFSAWCDRWMEAREEDPDLSPSTVKANKDRLGTIKLLFPPKTRLCDIDVKLCESIIHYLKTEGSPHGKRDLKPSYIASIETGISEVLQEAVRQGLMPNNPMRMTKKRTRKNDALHESTPSFEEIQTLVSMLDTRDPYQMAIYLCARCGLRRGEAMGIRWKDVDFKKRTLFIRQALKDDGNIGKPKTPSSVRAIAITDSIIEALKIRKRYQQECFEASVKAKLLPKMPNMPDTLMFADHVNQVKRVQSLDSWWYRHRSNYGLECTVHELRHAYITYMLGDLNVNPAIVQKAVGHKTATITLQTYSHISDTMVTTAMDAAEIAFTMPAEE